MKNIKIASCEWEVGDMTPGARFLLGEDATNAKAGDELLLVYHKNNDRWGLVHASCGVVEVWADCVTVLAFLNRYKATPVEFDHLAWPKVK